MTNKDQKTPTPLLIKTIITWFGCGMMPKAPGTMGTIGTIPLAWFICVSLPVSYRIVFAIIMTIFACWTVGIDQQYTTKKDPQYVVIDETVGFLWSTAWLPATWEAFLVAFILFRILDVLKPFPANFFDRSSKTAGTPFWRGAHIVLDDVAAGIYSAWIAWLFFKYILPQFSQT